MRKHKKYETLICKQERVVQWLETQLRREAAKLHALYNKRTDYWLKEADNG